MADARVALVIGSGAYQNVPRLPNPSNKRSQIIRNEATFTRYIKDPKASLPGTKMAFAGLRDEQQIKDLVTYLHQFDGNSVRATQ